MSAVEWSRPRQTPHAGRRKPTHTWCSSCERLHRTHRHVLGQEDCPAARAELRRRIQARFAGPAIAKPKAPRKRVRMQVGGVIEA